MDTLFKNVFPKLVELILLELLVTAFSMIIIISFRWSLDVDFFSRLMLINQFDDSGHYISSGPIGCRCQLGLRFSFFYSQVWLK